MFRKKEVKFQEVIGMRKEYIRDIKVKQEKKYKEGEKIHKFRQMGMFFKEILKKMRLSQTTCKYRYSDWLKLNPGVERISYVH